LSRFKVAILWIRTGNLWLRFELIIRLKKTLLMMNSEGLKKRIFSKTAIHRCVWGI